MLKSFARVSCNCLTQMGFHRIFINFVQGLGYMPTVGPTLGGTKNTNFRNSMGALSNPISFAIRISNGSFWVFLAV